MARRLLGFVALFAVLVGGVFTVRALSAQAHGGMMGMMSMMKDCPMMHGGMMGGHNGIEQEG